MSESGVQFPMQGVKCADCGCCQANVFAGGVPICWACDEGKPCAGANRRAGGAVVVTEARKEETMAKGNFGSKTPDDVRAAILANVDGLKIVDLAEKHHVHVSTVSAIRTQAGVVLRRGRRPGAQKVAAAAAIEKAAQPRPPLRPVEIDPQRPGTASSLLGALAKIDKANEKVKLSMEVTQGEIARFVAGLNDEQRVAFMNAGVRAALFG